MVAVTKPSEPEEGRFPDRVRSDSIMFYNPGELSLWKAIKPVPVSV